MKKRSGRNRNRITGNSRPSSPSWKLNSTIALPARDAEFKTWLFVMMRDGEIIEPVPYTQYCSRTGSNDDTCYGSSGNSASVKYRTASSSFLPMIRSRPIRPESNLPSSVGPDPVALRMMSSENPSRRSRPSTASDGFPLNSSKGVRDSSRARRDSWRKLGAASWGTVASGLSRGSSEHLSKSRGSCFDKLLM